MKKTVTILTLLVFTLFANRSYAYADSKLHLDLFNDGDFVVNIDGITYHNVRSGLDVSGLNPGTHRIRIVEIFHGRAHRNRNRSVLYDGTINIPFRSVVFARLTDNLQLRITEVRALPAPRPPQSTYRRPSPPNRNNGNYGGNRRGGYGYHSPQVDAFEVAKSNMNRASFDNDKLTIAKQFVKNGTTASEVASLMNLLSFEKNKLELAQFAYDFTEDPQNYHLVNKAFSFDSSVRALDRFITQERRN